jgi:hypothetical protein
MEALNQADQPEYLSLVHDLELKMTFTRHWIHSLQRRAGKGCGNGDDDICRALAAMEAILSEAETRLADSIHSALESDNSLHLPDAERDGVMGETSRRDSAQTLKPRDHGRS